MKKLLRKRNKEGEGVVERGILLERGGINFSSENQVFSTIGILSFFFFCLLNIHAFHKQ